MFRVSNLHESYQFRIQYLDILPQSAQRKHSDTQRRPSLWALCRLDDLCGSKYQETSNFIEIFINKKRNCLTISVQRILLSAKDVSREYS